MLLIRKYMILSIAAIALALFRTAAAADEIKVGTGIDCSSGKYGQTIPVVICVYPNSVHAFFGLYEFKLSVPYIDVKDGSGAKGYGDFSIFAAKTIAEDVLGLDGIELDLKVKARNGSVDLGLGTGHTAYAAGIGLTWLPSSQHLYFLYAGATSGSRLDSKTGAYATVWYKYLSSPNLRVGLIYENNEIGYVNRI